MRVLLGDGFGVTSRQIAVAVGRAGHDVAVLAPPGRPVLRHPRSIAEVHEVPAFGADPWAWLDRAEAVVRAEPYDVLLPTHDHVAVLAREPARITAHGAALAVPPFAALRRVADRAAAAATLTEIAMPQPAGTVVVFGAEELRQVADPPLYVKSLLGSHRVERREQLLRLADELEQAGAFVDGAGVLVQEPAEGPVLSAQAVFEHGRLVAVHAYEHLHGTAVKRSLVVPEVREHVAMLGGHLGWHGGLSLDAVLTARTGPAWLDVRPYLAEPANAAASGTDLVAALIAVSRGDAPASIPWGRAGVRTRQGAGALLTAARAGRWSVVRELARLAVRAGPYRDSVEETLSLRAEPRRIGAMALLTTALLAAPAGTLTRADHKDTQGALSPAAWRRIVAGAPPHVP
ncbi:hypothetical protein [Embleya sp. NBC_00896]|uniref:hypothetical protein n=1 Tax=Embleya sp. NBC_00896 TaxID=2975961 RepID=UPI003870D4C8|nr:hypothetical protein OG928_25300 [Embleya sp. NBC_00896]